jgi:hypothetical protein
MACNRHDLNNWVKLKKLQWGVGKRVNYKGRRGRKNRRGWIRKTSEGKGGKAGGLGDESGRKGQEVEERE